MLSLTYFKIRGSTVYNKLLAYIIHQFISFAREKKDEMTFEKAGNSTYVKSN